MSSKLRLQTGEEETDANIRKVRNGNQMLEFVANHPLRNMLPKSLFGSFTWFRFVIGGKNTGAGLNVAHCDLACDQEDIFTKNGRFQFPPHVRVVVHQPILSFRRIMLNSLTVQL